MRPVLVDQQLGGALDVEIGDPSAAVQ